MVLTSLRPYAKSVAGTLVINTALEIGGSLIGAAIGARVAMIALPLITRLTTPLSIFGASLFALNGNSKKRWAAVALFSLPIVLGVSHPWIQAGIEQTSGMLSTAIKTAGVVLGGYLGLRINTSLPLIDTKDPASSYGVAATRFELTGVFFRSLCLDSSIPFMTPILDVGMRITQFLAQTIAYQSNVLFPLMLDLCLRKKRPQTSVPLFVRQLAQHRLDEETKKWLASVFDRNRLNTPLIENLFNCLRRSAVQGATTRLDVQVGYLMKSFTAYLHHLQETRLLQSLISAHQESWFSSPEQEEEAFTALQDRIDPPGPGRILGDQLITPIVDKLTPTIHPAIQDLQIRLVGTRLFGEKQQNYLNRIIPLHVRGYIRFALANRAREEFLSAVTPEDEHQFFLNLSELFFTSYWNLSARPLQQGIRFLFRIYYAAQRTIGFLIARGDQSTYLADGRISPPITDYHTAPPPLPAPSSETARALTEAMGSPLGASPSTAQSDSAPADSRPPITVRDNHVPPVGLFGDAVVVQF